MLVGKQVSQSASGSGPTRAIFRRIAVDLLKGWSLVDATTKPGLFRTWYVELKNPDTRPIPRGPLPHLGIGAGLVTIFVGSFFVTHLADAFAVIVAYGRHAYFREGLRIVDWKHDVLSTGGCLSFVGKLVKVLTTLMLMAVGVSGADFCSMHIQQVIRRNGRWTGMAFRLMGGTALLAFARHLYGEGGWGLHPVPLSALLGGAVLAWKGFASIFRKSNETTT